MPFLRVYTNAELTVKHEEFVERAAEMVAAELGKPVGYVVVALGRPQKMSFGGKCDNAGVLAYMDSIGFGSHKAALVKKLNDFFERSFAGVAARNINIVLTNMPAADVAIGGSLLG